MPPPLHSSVPARPAHRESSVQVTRRGGGGGEMVKGKEEEEEEEEEEGGGNSLSDLCISQVPAQRRMVRTSKPTPLFQFSFIQSHSLHNFISSLKTCNLFGHF